MKRISKTYKFRLILKPSQEKTFRGWAGSCRMLYNCALEEKILYWNQYKINLSEYDQSSELKVVKVTEGLSWFKDVPAQCLQQVLKDLNRAYKGFFKGGGFPKFKSRGSGDSFRFPQPSQFSIRKLTKRLSAIRLPKIGEVRFRQSCDLVGRIRNATVIRNGEHWYICFNCEQEIVEKTNSGSSIGVDRGIVHTLVVSDKVNFKIYNLPHKVIELEHRRSRLQSRIKNKKKFSNNWKKSQGSVRKLNAKLSRIRLDFHHKVTTELSQSHRQICLEDLNVRNMSKSARGSVELPGKNVAQKKGLNRSILRQGWSQFESLLEYKASWYGSAVKYVDPKYSSQTCSRCDHCSSANRQSQSVFVCISCGKQMNADVNAAEVILTRGQRGRACGDVGVTQVFEAGTSMAV